LDIDIRFKEKTSKNYIENTVAEEIVSKKAQNVHVLAQFEKDLDTENMANRTSQNALTMLRQKLDEKKRQIEYLKNSAGRKNEPMKNFPASDKLASAVKPKSVSPVKSPLEVGVKKTPTPRVKSIPRRGKK
jgi:5-formyltetrahydrofolate cyclo-ligase